MIASTVFATQPDSFMNNEKLFVALQSIAPQHALSRIVGSLANCQQPWLKNTMIEWFIKRYKVDMSEALEPNPRYYAHFNSFFIRKLKPDARPVVATPNAVACPVDGRVSQLGKIDNDQIFQAKGHHYSLQQLLGSADEWVNKFRNGYFATLYLAPANYHRIHMPLDGQLKAMWHVPGKLFSVSPVTTRGVPNLFARNERVITVFETAAGPMILVLVGAMIVASINTVWAGEITPQLRKSTVSHWNYDDQKIYLKRGDEMGYFKLGSTVIALFANPQLHWLESLTEETPIKMGQLIANY